MALDPKKRLLEKLKIGLGKSRPVKAPTGTPAPLQELVSGGRTQDAL